MPGLDIQIDDDGTVYSIVFDENNNKRGISFQADNKGNIKISGEGPSGSKSGIIEPSGNGDTRLGK